MALLSKPIERTFDKPYLEMIANKIKDGQSISFIKSKKKTDFKVKLTPEIKKLITAIEKKNKTAVKKILETSDGKLLAIFTKSGEDYFKFNEIDKAPFSGIGGGKIDAATTAMQEHCSLISIENALSKGPAKTLDEFSSRLYQDLYKLYKGIDGLWLNTFYQQSLSIHKELKGKTFNHYSRDDGFMDFITDFVKKEYKIAKKDSWDPADIWLVNNVNKQQKELIDLVKDNVTTIEQFNDKLRAKFFNNEIVGISLKKMSGKTASYELVNLPKEGFILDDDYNNFKMISMRCFLKYNKGFQSTDTIIKAKTKTQEITFQIRPNGTGVQNLKFEATMKGSNAARLGKVPLDMLAVLMKTFKVSLKNSHKDYPKTTEEYILRKDEFISLFNKTIKGIESDIKTSDEFNSSMISAFEKEPNIAFSKLMQLDFLSKIIGDEDDILTSMAYLAQKKGNLFGPFGKLY
jgi:hypothetical protein